MSRAEKIALALIWLGIVGGIVAVLFSWQVRREWVDPGGYMLVRRNLLTSEVDVWIAGQWVPLQRAGSRGPLLAESRPRPAEAPPGVDPDQPLLPARAPSHGLTGMPDEPPPRAAPAPHRARPHAPVRVRTAPPPPPEPPPEAAAPSPQAALPPAEDESPPPVATNPDIPIVRAPSPDELPEAEAPPPPPPDQVASGSESAPAPSALGPA